MDIPPLSLWLPSYVVEYVKIPASINHVPSKKLWAGNRWLGEVPRLAICKNYLTEEFHLSHCDDEWQDLCSVESRSELTQVKILAEKHYPGISEFWESTDYREEDAVTERNDIIKEDACSFCNKSFHDEDSRITNMIGTKEPRICNICITEFYEAINSEET